MNVVTQRQVVETALVDAGFCALWASELEQVISDHGAAEAQGWTTLSLHEWLVADATDALKYTDVQALCHADWVVGAVLPALEEWSDAGAPNTNATGW